MVSGISFGCCFKSSREHNKKKVYRFIDFLWSDVLLESEQLLKTGIVADRVPYRIDF
jgi:hypothetical protein